MRVKADSILGRLVTAARPRRTILHLTLSPPWSEILIAAGAQRAESSDSMRVNYPTRNNPEQTTSHTSIEPSHDQSLFSATAPAAQPRNVGYGSTVACAAADITYRQLDFWARSGLVEPGLRTADGGRHLYSVRDIVTLKVVKRLLDTGISMQQISSAVNRLRSRGNADLAHLTLMSDGHSVYECSSMDEVVNLLAGGEAVFGIAIGHAWQEVATALRALPSEPSNAPDELAIPLADPEDSIQITPLQQHKDERHTA